MTNVNVGVSSLKVWNNKITESQLYGRNGAKTKVVGRPPLPVTVVCN